MNVWMPLQGSDIMTLVDREDFDRLASRGWTWSSFRRQVIATTGKREGLSRVILDAPDGMFVDHINGNTLDNRRANLRVCTQAENNRNRAISRANKVGFKGVAKRQAIARPFRAVIYLNGKQIALGRYATAQVAAAAYDAAAMHYHGAFARTNFPRV